MGLDPDVCRLEQGRLLLGGDPGRLLRLTPDGVAGLVALASGRAGDPSVLRLARTLVDGGLAHPRPRPAPVEDAVVVVPVRDRTDELDRCLSALGQAVPVLVVDDGSRLPDRVAEVGRRHGARVLHLPRNGGPAAARNAGLAETRSALVAFVDSDVVVPTGWLDGIVGHFVDPAVGAVAPRVRAGGSGGSLLAAYARERGPLDLGDREAQVRPGGRVPYVPSAALVVRRAALPVPPFDAELRYGEDVDLVWRLHDGGWTVRYEPRTVVRHEEPDRWSAWLWRRHRYGTSAAPLADRHGPRLTPLVLPTLPVLTWLLLASGRPVRALAVAAVSAGRLHRTLRGAALRRRDCARTAVRVTVQSVVGTARGLGGAGAVVTTPLLLALLLVRRTRRTAAVVLLAPALLGRVRRPAVPLLPWTVLWLLDDLAYASGVWAGCWGRRTLVPLLPRHKRPQ